MSSAKRHNLTSVEFIIQTRVWHYTDRWLEGLVAKVNK